MCLYQYTSFISWLILLCRNKCMLAMHLVIILQMKSSTEKFLQLAINDLTASGPNLPQSYMVVHHKAVALKNSPFLVVAIYVYLVSGFIALSLREDYLSSSKTIRMHDMYMMLECRQYIKNTVFYIYSYYVCMYVHMYAAMCTCCRPVDQCDIYFHICC